MANEHKLLSKKAPKKEKSKDPKFDRLKTIKHNPRKVSLEDVETGEIKTFPSIYKAAKFIDQSLQTINYWDGRVWKKKNIRLRSNNFIMSIHRHNETGIRFL